MLCSDGLSGQVSKDDISAVVSREQDLTAACRLLIDRANENGGPDNITVIVARFEGAGLRAPGNEDEVGHRVFPLPDTGQTPAMPMDRVLHSESPVDAAPGVEASRASGSAKRNSAATPAHPVSAHVDAGARRSSGKGADAIPDVSPARRSAGRVIAYVLLGLLVVAATWFAAKQFRHPSDSTAASTPKP